MFKFESLTHRSTMYFWWLCSDLSHIGMDPQCMSGGHDLSYLTWIFACRHLCFVLHIIFVIPMIVNDVNLSIAFRGVTVA
jgi:hypothetical protein